MSGRLPTHLWVAGVRRLAAERGDFAAVLSKGDPDAGAVLLVLRDRTGLQSAYARQNVGDGRTEWRPLVQNEPDPANMVKEILEKQRRYDPDLWVIELDTADPARFIVELAELN